MSYAVLQLGLHAPSTEQVERAFGRVKGLTELDALAVGKAPFGMLARGYDLPMADALKEALIQEGVASEIIEEANLPPLPDPFNLTRLDFSPEALVVYDSLGRPKEIPWADVFIIAAGKVSVREFVETRQPWDKFIGQGEYKLLKTFVGPLTFTDRHYTGKGHGHWKLRPVDITTKEQEHDRHLLEIILTGGKARYTINADKSLMVFSCLGERRTNNVSRDFLTLVRDLLQYTPHATLNRGAFAAQENAVEPFTYASKTAFHNEIIWLLWQASREQAQ